MAKTREIILSAVKREIILSAVKNALADLIKENIKLNYLINKEKWQSITQIRAELFNLRKNLNEIKHQTPKVIAFKKIVHEKLVYLARNWPLNERQESAGMRCPISDEKVDDTHYYVVGSSNIVLSNGYIYNCFGIIEVLRSDQPFPTDALPNISEYDIAKIQKVIHRHKMVMAALGIPAGLFTALTLFVLCAMVVPSLPIIMPLLSILAIGLAVGGIVAAIIYHAGRETRSRLLELVPTSSTTNCDIHGALGSKRRSDKDKRLASGDERLDSGDALKTQPVGSPVVLQPVYNDPPRTNKM